MEIEIKLSNDAIYQEPDVKIVVKEEINQPKKIMGHFPFHPATFLFKVRLTGFFKKNIHK